MSKIAERRLEIENFIQSNIREHAGDITRLTQEKFALTKPAVMKYINDLILEKKIAVSGVTKNREYRPLPIMNLMRGYPISSKLEESAIWREFSPLFGDVKENVRRICQYGFTEMINNAIEHSEGSQLVVNVAKFYDQIEIIISDNGIGIFEKIKTKLNLDDPIHSILELSKGKLTTDEKKHSGEGIFFTSRAFDVFFMTSKKIGFVHIKSGFDYIDQGDQITEGTSVKMDIALLSNKSLQKIFDEYTDSGEFGFSKTTVPVHLATYGDDQLISRSQARRLLTRFEKFSSVVLDFKSVEMIGQAFADEIFRVYKNEHPKIILTYMNANRNVEKMIKHVQASKT